MKASPQAAEVIPNMWNSISEKLLDAVNIEPDEAFISHLLITYYETIEILGPNCLSAEQMGRIATLIVEQAQRFVQNAKDREGNSLFHDDVILVEMRIEEDILMRFDEVCGIARGEIPLYCDSQCETGVQKRERMVHSKRFHLLLVALLLLLTACFTLEFHMK